MKVKQRKLFSEVYFEVINKKRVYLVTLNPLKCSCKAFLFSRGEVCKHIKAVVEFVEEVRK
jgi:predicted nucleic acid-binding Zn finger protein